MLRHVRETEPGIGRRRCGRGFGYFLPSGEPLRDEGALARIRALAVPPAWREVWICVDGSGHLQATGRDARGRKQYRYHPEWRRIREADKYARMAAFGTALPRLRRRVALDLKRPGLDRRHVIATVVRLLEATLMRVGNEEYVRMNGSYGLTTLRNRHVLLSRDAIRIRCRGKHGIVQRAEVTDPRLAEVVRRCRELPGQLLFQYVDGEGTRHAVDSGDVNAYLHESMGEEFTAKDFRTWFGSLAALECLDGRCPETLAQGRSTLVEVLGEVAGRLGNTPRICRKCYVHPVVIDAYLDGRLARRPPRLRAERRLLELLAVAAGDARRRPERAPRRRGHGGAGERDGGGRPDAGQRSPAGRRRAREGTGRTAGANNN